MNTKNVRFRYYAELNDFLSKEKHKISFDYHFSGRPTVKDAIEACGVPHPEVEIILANDRSVGFDYHICDGDRIAVYPEFESIDISPILKLRDLPLRKTKFILDTHLGKLAKNLRMLGFDVLYENKYSNQEIIACSLSQKRIILTRDQGLLKHKEVSHGYWIRSTEPDNQIIEIIRRLDLLSQIKPFSRCLLCNKLLEAVSKKQIAGLLLPKTRKYYTDYKKCSRCESIYWSGSHYHRMEQKIDKIKRSILATKQI